MSIAILAASLVALAHVGAPVDAVDIHPVGTDGRFLEASIGVAWSEDGGTWDWVCHEAITTPDAVIIPQYAVAGRRWIATVPALEQARTEQDAVYWTDDGCTWTVSTGLTDHSVLAVAIDPTATVALAVTDDEADTNSIFRSTDGGSTFAEVLPLEGHTFTSVVLSKSDSEVAMVGSVDAAGRGYLHWSTDLGATWASHDVIEGEVVAMALHPGDPTIGYAVVDGVGVETLLITADAGESVEVLLDPEGFLTDVAVAADGQAWVGFQGTAFLHAADGRTFELATEAPPGLGVETQGDQVLLATRFELVNSALAEGTLEGGFTPLFSFVSFAGPLDCPAGTEGAEICAPLFPVLQDSLGLGSWDTGDTGSTGGGSGSGGSGSASGSGSGSGSDGVTDTADGTVVGPGTTDKDSGCGSSAWFLLLPVAFFGLGRRPRRDGAR